MDVSYDYAYVCANAYAYVYAYTYVYVNVYAYVYAYVYASAYGYAYVYGRFHVYARGSKTRGGMLGQIYACVCVYVPIRTNLHIVSSQDSFLPMAQAWNRAPQAVLVFINTASMPSATTVQLCECPLREGP